MSENTNKSRVRRNFSHARELMRQAEYIMKSGSRDFDDAEAIANELIASVATFSEWIDEQREEVSA